MFTNPFILPPPIPLHPTTHFSNSAFSSLSVHLITNKLLKLSICTSLFRYLPFSFQTVVSLPCIKIGTSKSSRNTLENSCCKLLPFERDLIILVILLPVTTSPTQTQIGYLIPETCSNCLLSTMTSHCDPSSPPNTLNLHHIFNHTFSIPCIHVMYLFQVHKTCIHSAFSLVLICFRIKFEPHIPSRIPKTKKKTKLSA